MTNKAIHIPISLYLGDNGLVMAYEHPRVTKSAATLEPTLELGEHERVIFEAADFVANGTTYRIKGSASTTTHTGIDWERHISGCRSPIISEPMKLSITLTATPASNSAASTSSTSTTVIKKKGRPTPLTP